MNKSRFILVHKKNKVKDKKKGTKSLLWYDSFYKTLLTFDGISLSFFVKKETYINTKDGPISLDDAIKKVKQHNVDKYKKWISDYIAKKVIEKNCNILTKYRLFPKPIEPKVASAKSININNVIDKYMNYNNSSVEVYEEFDTNIIVQCQPQDIEDFCDTLERDKIEYEII